MKYDLIFKQSVIAYYDAGNGLQATAKHFGIAYKSTVDKWVKQYKFGGVEAIRPKRSKAVYSADFKYQVLTVMEQEGLSGADTALQFSITSPSLVGVWRKRYASDGMLGLMPKPKGKRPMSKKAKNAYIADKPDDEKTIAELKRELDYLRAENEYLKKLDALPATPSNPKKQG